jgi:hypothetical protein
VLQLEFGNLPEVLAIEISRSAVDRLTFQPYKLSQSLGIDQVLKVRDTDFGLRGVFIHYGGSLGSGHYAVAVRPGLDDKWFLLSDMRVTNTTFSAVQKEGAVNGTFFVYARADTEEANFRPVDDSEIPPLVDELSRTTEIETTGITVTFDLCLVQNANSGTYGYRCAEHEIVIDVGVADTAARVYQKVAEAMHPTPDFRLWARMTNGRCRLLVFLGFYLRNDVRNIVIRSVQLFLFFCISLQAGRSS